MTTFEPRAPYSPAELDKLYPKSLQLQQVQVVHRHGERSPVSGRFQKAGLSPYWPYCTSAKMLKSIVMLTPDAVNWDVMQWRRRLETMGAQDSPILARGPGGEVDNVCLPGETTDKGRATCFALGTRLRHLYIDQLKFLPNTLTSTSDFYLRSTQVPRALDAVQQSFSGLYPSSTRSPTLEPPIIHTRTLPEESLIDNENTCKRYGMLYRAFGERAAGRWNDSPEMAYINKKISKWMPDNAPKVAVDGSPRLSGVMDTVNATRAHGPETKLPSEFYDPQLLANIDKIVVEEWFAGYQENMEFRRLGKGQMVGDVTEAMVDSALGRGEQPMKFAMSGAHDTTLAGFLASLGAFQGEPWPRFTSHVAIELFRNSSKAPSSTPASKPSWWSSLFGSALSSSNTAASRKPLADFSSSDQETLKDYYVRIRYNDKPVSIPGCRKPGNHHAEGGETFCTLEAFKQIADAFTPKDWKKECRLALDQKVDITRYEPAGYPAGEGPSA